MTVAAVAMGSAVATAMLGVMLDIGDRVNRELRSLGANLMVTPKGRVAAGRNRRHQLSAGGAATTSFPRPRCRRSSPSSGI